MNNINFSLEVSPLEYSCLTDLLQEEKRLFKKYQHNNYLEYKHVRLEYLSEYSDNSLVQELIKYINSYKPRIGIYAGSFNPFHQGHYNILEKAERLFDKVIILRGLNPNKNNITITAEESNIISPKLQSREFATFTGFLTDYIAPLEEYAEITLIRGLRNGDDLDYEINQLRFMEDMKDNINILFLPCDKEYEHISSTSIRNLNKIDKDFSKRYEV